jgi:plasmid stabilization system protein ParE
LEYKVLYSKAALIGLNQILAFIHKDDPAAASHLANAILDHIDFLASFPKMGPPLPARPGMRKLLHTPIVVYYRINDKKRVVEVIRFWHTSRRPPKYS